MHARKGRGRFGAVATAAVALLGAGLLGSCGATEERTFPDPRPAITGSALVRGSHTVLRDESVDGLPPYPPDFPRIEYQRVRPGPEGLFALSTVRSRGIPAWVMVFDQDGNARWWYRPSTLAFGAQVLPSGEITWGRGFGDGYGIDPRSGAEVHRPDGSLVRIVRTPGAVTDVHEYHPAPDGNVFIGSYVPEGPVDLSRWGGPRATNVTLPRIVELDPEGRVLWEWSSRGHIAMEESERWWNNNVLSNAKVVRGEETYDAVHLNSIEPWGDRQVVISTRHTDAIYGITKENGEVAWKLGGTPTDASLRIVGDPHGQDPFGGQHDARIVGDVLSVYDNGTHRGRPPRAAFYRIDLDRRTATFITALTDPIIESSHCCGSVRTFDDGWLVNWGDNRWITGFDSRGRVSFRLHLPSSTYRAVPVPPGSVTTEELAAGMAAQPDRRVPLLTP